jgi:DNA-binding MarR family transcriptional regulator
VSHVTLSLCYLASILFQVQKHFNEADWLDWPLTHDLPGSILSRVDILHHKGTGLAYLPEDTALDQIIEEVRRLALEMSWHGQRRLAVRLEQYNLTGPQFLTLVALAHQGGSCAIGRLARDTHQLSATMTGIVDRLKRQGWVQREQDPTDRRSWLVVLTDEGWRKLQAAKQAEVEHTRSILQRFSPDERAEMIRLLRLYVDTAREIEQATTAAQANSPT